MTIEKLEAIAFRLIKVEARRFDCDQETYTELGGYVRGIVDLETEIDVLLKYQNQEENV